MASFTDQDTVQLIVADLAVLQYCVASIVLKVSKQSDAVGSAIMDVCVRGKKAAPLRTHTCACAAGHITGIKAQLPSLQFEHGTQ